MVDFDSVVPIIYAAIDEHNAVTDGPKLEKSPECVLFGKGGGLDSVGLVNFIVTVEEGIETRFGKVLTLADERAMSQKSSPFRTVDSLAKYVVGLLAEDGVG